MVKLILELFDIFRRYCDIIVCQVNCVGILNSGIGIFIKSLFPHVYSEYRKICATSSPDNNLLGRTYMFDIEGDRQMALVFCLSPLHTKRCTSSFVRMERQHAFLP